MTCLTNLGTKSTFSSFLPSGLYSTRFARCSAAACGSSSWAARHSPRRRMSSSELASDSPSSRATGTDGRMRILCDPLVLLCSFTFSYSEAHFTSHQHDLLMRSTCLYFAQPHRELLHGHSDGEQRHEHGDGGEAHDGARGQAGRLGGGQLQDVRQAQTQRQVISLLIDLLLYYCVCCKYLTKDKLPSPQARCG